MNNLLVLPQGSARQLVTKINRDKISGDIEENYFLKIRCKKCDLFLTSNGLWKGNNLYNHTTHRQQKDMSPLRIAEAKSSSLMGVTRNYR